MPINQAPVAAVRQPRGIVRVNDEVVSGWIDWEVENNNFHHADTFRVTFASSALPVARGVDWFSAQSSIRVEIFGGFPADPDNVTTAGLPMWIAGFADDIEIDMGSREIHLHGRDYTALLIDNQTSENFRNKTASDIAKLIAGMFQLTTKFITPTTTKVGKYIEVNTGQLTHGQSYWDLLTMIASIEQMVVYVSSNDLHFEKAPDASSEPYLLQWNDAPFSFNGSRLAVSHNLNLANNVQVIVRSFHPRVGLVTAKWPTSAPNGGRVYQKKYPNMLPEAALKKAKSLYAEIMQHEVRLTAELPADDLLTITTVIRLSGTQFDQIYFPDSIVRRMSTHEGYTMSLTAKNSAQAGA